MCQASEISGTNSQSDPARAPFAYQHFLSVPALRAGGIAHIYSFNVKRHRADYAICAPLLARATGCSAPWRQQNRETLFYRVKAGKAAAKQ
ncbi:MAG: hypothetical protein DU430_03935 [Candidatus Tokpelaia sp.]|nr:MAG: hypothetical protein DU430_03935 [Candidatus Tokpelaia sp.]KAA6405173.1 hypothetical protein DPQ22_06450 [Candidatus Tokpelaia sp.]